MRSRPAASVNRRLRYSVAMSLDGYIASPKGDFDWIVHDPDIDFRKLGAAFDTAFMGRKTYEAVQAMGPSAAMAGMKSYVFSRTLRQEDCKGMILSTDPAGALAEVRRSPGKDIWLFGGGSLFRSCLDAGLVDAVEIAIVPVLLGGGLPMLPIPAGQAKLKLTGHRIYRKTGTVSLEYAVVRA